MQQTQAMNASTQTIIQLFYKDHIMKQLKYNIMHPTATVTLGNGITNIDLMRKIHAGLKLETIISRVGSITMGRVRINTQDLTVQGWDFSTGSYCQAGTYTTKENLVYLATITVADYLVAQDKHWDARRAALRKQGLNI